MKKLLRALALVMAAMLALSACGSGAAPSGTESGGEAANVQANPGVKTINLWSFTDEVPGMVEDYKKLHPDLPYDFKTTIIATSDGGYQIALDAALAAGGAEAPDIFCAEAAFIKKYVEGPFTATYKSLGIDVDAEAKAAGIAQYTMDVGSYNGEVKGLGYQATGGAFIYRRSLAKEVLGSDEPNAVQEAIKDWDSFFDTARKMKAAGYAMVSGDGDLWHPMENSRKGKWIEDNKLVLDDNVMQFFEFSKILKQEGLSNETTDWTEAWYADMAGTGVKPVFGFFGPAWLINYVMKGNSGGTAPGEGTYGDWGVCVPTTGFYWGGTWVLANANTTAKAEVADLIRWITLDSSDTGLQASWALGDTVASSVVMEKTDGHWEFIGNQDAFEVFVPANEKADGHTLGPFDENINSLFRDQVREYASGNKDKEQAVADFQMGVANIVDLDS
ncbi:MAG: ABC transporter substrate-binding protein [Clostridiales bacterium]|jgi:hypothetical protein|nr:ABC transporter substrate-binding protein [Clostridiales bacterium]